MASFKVLSLNTRGMRNIVKRRTVFDFVNTLQADICFLQEVHLRDAGDIQTFAKEWTKGDSVWSVGGVHATGVGILFGSKEIMVEASFVIVQGRIMGTDVTWGTVKLRVIVVYGPQSATERKDMIGQVEPHLATSRQVILGGDLNVELGRGGDTSDVFITNLMAKHGLVDGLKGVKPHALGPTWRNSRGAAKRLDYIFTSRSLSLLAGRVLPVFFSDHDGVLLEVRSCAPVFGSGFWRLNINILEEEVFIKDFRVFFRGLVGLRPMCPGAIEWWEVAKERIKAFCVRYSKRKARWAKREALRLQRLLELEYTRGNSDGTLNQQACDSLKSQLREVFESKARAYLLQSREKFIESFETCSASFFSSIRADRAKRVVTGVRDEQGRIVSDRVQMVRAATDYYRTAFSEKEIDVGSGEVFLDLLTQRVPLNIAQTLDAPLTLEELEGALNRMNRRKVPGIDGLPAEFYLKFWDILGPVLLEILSAVLRTGAMGGSLATGVISLLFKKGDPTDLGNWRPLTMLCVDYKLLAKVLADRLGTALAHVVHVDQTCAVAGRSVRWNLQLIRDAVAWAEDRQLPLMVVSLDQAKAFDRVHWGFMFRVLSRLGFTDRFVGWLRVLYTSVGSTVSVNGHLGEVFRVHAGVRQGCPLSPLLYILYMEPLAAAIRADPGVKGFLIPGSGGLRVKLSQYADDTTLLLDSDACLTRSLEIIQSFGRAAGAKLNTAKSSLKFFGRWKDRTDVPGGLPLCEGPLKVLGVSFEIVHSATVNWTRRFLAAQKKLALWRSRKLTLIGKVLVLKVDVLPSLLYLAYIYPLPVSMRRPLMRLVFSFIWGGRYEYVSRTRMMAAIEAGGRDVPHLPLKLDCIFVSFLFSQLSVPVAHPSGHFMRLYFSYQARGVIAWSNLAPRVEQQPWHYHHAARWLRAHPEASGTGVLLSHRALYQVARKGVVAPAVVGTPAGVWWGIQPRGLDNGLKDLNWLCLHGCLPVRELLYRHGLTRAPVCPRIGCLHDETIRHVMWDCTFASEGWKRANKWLVQLVPGFHLTWSVVKRGVSLGRTMVLTWLIVSLVKRGLWRARQDLVNNKEVSVEGVVKRIELELKGRIMMDIRKWGKHAALERWKGGLGLRGVPWD